MSRSGRVGQILDALRAEDADGDDADLPQRLVQACTAALPVSGVGLVWMSGAGPGAMLAATDGPARVMEELQFTLGEGPCIESSRTRRPVLVPDLARTGPTQWPEFTAGAVAAGICAVFAFPLQIGAIPLGVLELYRDATGLLDRTEVSEALAFADAATSVLLAMQSAMDSDELDEAFAGPLGARDQVHQATGMIAVQAGVSLVEALALLRARSFATSRSVGELARDVLDHLLRFDP